jgi:hypothetical protein
MRNTTKLKAVLMKYSIFMQMDDAGLLSLTLVDKITLKEESFEATNYSSLISRAYSHLLRELRKEEID